MNVEAVTTDERCCLCGAPARYRVYHGGGHWGKAFCGAESFAAMIAAQFEAQCIARAGR